MRSALDLNKAFEAYSYRQDRATERKHSEQLIGQGIETEYEDGDFFDQEDCLTNEALPGWKIHHEAAPEQRRAQIRRDNQNLVKKMNLKF